MKEKDLPLPKKTATLGEVKVAYTDLGDGEPILFVHGIPTSSYLWRNVIRALLPDFRLVAPDLMGLGDTETPLSHRFDMEAQADKILELADHLELSTFNLVCHDQGGAAAQWLAVKNPQRIRRFIITNCVCYDNWPVPLVKYLTTALKVRPLAHLNQKLNIPPLWGKSFCGMRLGVYDKKTMTNEAIDEYLKFGKNDPDSFWQFHKFALSGDCRYSVEAARHFSEFDRPTLVLWAGNDRWLSVSWAWRLYTDIAGAKKLAIIPFAGHFFQEEKPELCAQHIRDFIRDEPVNEVEDAASSATTSENVDS